MPIPVACQCGQQFAAPDHLAGQNVQCPKCQSPINIPNPQVAANQFGAAADPMAGMQQPGGMQQPAGAGAQCPSCFAAMQPGAIVCVECGFHAETGERIESVSYVEQDTKNAAMTTPTDQMLQMAEDQIDDDIAESKKTDGLPWFVYFILFAVVVGGAATMIALNPIEFEEEEEQEGPKMPASSRAPTVITTTKLM